MNNVCIKYTYVSTKAEIEINGEHISSYSELSSCLNTPLHICADRIIALLDEEIYDEYIISLRGYEFQYELLNAAIKKSDFCHDIKFSPIQSVNTIDNILIFCYNMSEKYGLKNSCNENLRILDKTKQVQLQDSSNVKFVSETDKYDIIVVNGENDEDEVSCRTVVTLGDALDYINKKGHTYITIPLNLLDIFIKYLISILVKAPYIEQIIDELRYVSVTGPEKAEIEAYTTGAPTYFFADFPTAMDVNDTLELDFRVFPETYSHFYKILIDNNKTVGLTGNKLQALNSGNATLSIADRSGNIVETRDIYVTRHTYVEEIKLIPSFEFLRVNEKGRIDIFISPEKAEDSSNLNWSVSNKDILRLRNDGSVAALKPGLCTITVSGNKASASLNVEVKPVAESIRIYPESVNIRMGKSETLHCSVYPANAIKGTIKWQLDNNMLGTITTADNGETCYFTAGTSAIGTGNLYCSINGTNISAACPVTVKKLNTHGGLLVMAILSLCLCLWPISLPLSIVGCVLTHGESNGFNTCVVLNIILAIAIILANVL